MADGNYRRSERVIVEFYAECDICGYVVNEGTQAFADEDMGEHIMVDHKEQPRLIDDGIGVTGL